MVVSAGVPSARRCYANLDSAHGADTMRLLRRLAKEEATTTVLIVSHDERLRDTADRVLWLEDGRFKTIAALAPDPVCGMLVEPDRAVRLNRGGETMYFCADGCRQQWKREHPAAAAAAATSRST